MLPLVDAFWRAFAYCLHPVVLAWALVPLVLAGALVFGLGLAYWEAAVAAVRAALEQWELLTVLLRWLDAMGGAALHALIAPMIVVALALPLLVLVTLVLVALLVTPGIVSLVARRRFPALERRRGAPWWQSLLWSLSCAFTALVALVFSLPLWFVPPLVLLLPPLIWGWLTARVLAFDVLAAHASAAERRLLMHEHRWTLLLMGLACGAVGSLPSLLLAFGGPMLPLAPLLAIGAVWIYTVIFAFAACWFSHFLLHALQRLREGAPAAAPAALIGEAS